MPVLATARLPVLDGPAVVVIDPVVCVAAPAPAVMVTATKALARSVPSIDEVKTSELNELETCSLIELVQYADVVPWREQSIEYDNTSCIE